MERHTARHFARTVLGGRGSAAERHSVAAAEHGWDFGAAVSRRTGAGAGCARGLGGEEFDSGTEEGGGGGREGVRD
jgi:hypothetical protein